MRTFWSLLVLAATAALCRAEPKDVIKAYNLEVTPIEYKGSFRPDPFIPKVPLKAGASPEDWRVRIASLKLTSVILGTQGGGFSGIIGAELRVHSGQRFPARAGS